MKQETLDKIQLLEEKAGIPQTNRCTPELTPKPDITPILHGDFIGGPYKDAQKYTLTKGYSLKIPTCNEITPYSARFIGESTIIPDDKAGLAQKTIELGKLVLNVPYSMEIEQDSELYQQFLKNTLPTAIDYAVNYSIVYGSNEIEAGNSSVEGIVDSAATYSTAVVHASAIGDQIRDVVKNTTCSDDNIWIFSKQAFDTLIDNAASLVEWFKKECFMLGSPVYCAEWLKSGHYVFGDFTKYIIAQKSLKQSVSEHVGFLNDDINQKITLRIGGMVGSGPYSSITMTPCSEEYTYGATMGSNLTGIDYDTMHIVGYAPGISAASTTLSGLEFIYAGDNELQSNICRHTDNYITSAGDIVINENYWLAKTAVISGTGVTDLSGDVGGKIQDFQMFDANNNIFVTVADTTASEKAMLFAGTITPNSLSGTIEYDDGTYTLAGLTSSVDYWFDAKFDEEQTLALSGNGFTAYWNEEQTSSLYPFAVISGM
jgi:hypothetical protein